jgi:hypothetical protein
VSPRLTVEMEPGVYKEVEWPNCATPDCPNLRCMWSGTPLCFPCAERELGHTTMAALYAQTHPGMSLDDDDDELDAKESRP